MSAPVLITPGAGDSPPKRAVCVRCRRPAVVCYCAHLPTLPTRTRVMLLQHPRERDMAIGTARMAHLALPNSDLRVATDFSADPVVAAAVAGAAPSYLLFPGRDAVDVGSLPREKAINLFVLDGTWWQAGKLLKLNPMLQSLPRVAFAPIRPSDYRIRRQPAPFCVSTIEALAEVLNFLEPPADDQRPFDRLLEPFRAMIERQQWFATQVRSQRHRHELRVPRVPAATARLRAEWSRLVCVQGEANAWSKRDPARQPAELVHWTACRPATGETFEVLLAPRRPLAPGTPAHTGLAAATLAGGTTVAAWLESWRRFVRPDDVVVAWGHYYGDLAAAEGLPLPTGGVDLRVALSQLMHERAGTIEDWIAELKLTPPALPMPGRAGRRLAALLALLEVVKNPPLRRGRPAPRRLALV
jgi:DTW domain-containing protein YfiP